jgi:4-amino-4-deoxy-L-arabinose transferase-like glycosyltransferase
MRQQIVHQLLVVAAAAVIAFTTLGGAALWDEDEPLYAACAWEMLQRGDWVVPYYNGEMFPDKPPLMYWMMMSGMETFGRTEFAVRVWSAVLAIGTALVTYHIGRLLFDAKTGLWAGLIVCSSFIFTISARAATVDSALTFVTALGFLLFVVAGIGRKPEREDETVIDATLSPSWYAPKSWLIHAGIWTCMSVAVLGKGPIGLLLPMASIGLFLMIMNYRRQVALRGEKSGQPTWGSLLTAVMGTWSPVNFARSLWQLRPITGVVIVALIAAPWFVWVGMRNELWLEQFFAKFNLRPFTEPILGHSGPIWYHIPSVLIGFFPWSIFMVPVLIDWYEGVKRNDRRQAGYLLVACWFGVNFVFWSICKTKLPHYPLPAYPALALATASFVVHWSAEPERWSRGWLRGALWISVVVGVGMGVGLPVAARFVAPGEEIIGVVGVIMAVGAGLSLWYYEKRQFQRVMPVYALTTIAFVTAFFGFLLLRVDRHQYAKDLVAAVRADAGTTPNLIGYCFIRESVVYYAENPMSYSEDVEEVQRLAAGRSAPFIVTLDEHEERLKGQFGGRLREVHRCPRFLHGGEVVVFRPLVDSPDVETVGRMPETERR